MRLVSCWVGILGGLIPALLAQTPSSNSFFQDTVVVTASLDEAEREKLPASVSVVGPSELTARQIPEALHYLATLPGVGVVQSGEPGSVTSIFIRGSSSTQTLVLWNGLVLNDPFFGGFDWAFLSTDGVERIEVVRGPASTIYGSDAVGGVVQLLSGREQDAWLRLEGGDRDYGRAAFGTGAGRDNLYAEMVGAYRTGKGELPNSFFDGAHGFARGEWRMEGGPTIALLARFADQEIGIPQSGGQPTPRRRQSSESFDLALPASLQGRDWTLETLVSRVTSDFQFRDPDASFSLDDTKAECLRGRLVASFAPTPEASLGVGGEWQDSEVDNASNFGVNLDGRSQDNRAVFAQVRASSGRVTFDGALRYDDHESFGVAWSPAGGISFALSEKARLRLSYAEAFRAPSLGELFFPFSGNPDLAPETSQSIDLGFDLSGASWRFGVSAFELAVEDLIEFDLASFVNVNVGRARSRGVEAEVSFEQGPWRLSANGTYLDAEDRLTGERLLRRARERFNSQISWSDGPWSFHLIGRYVGDRPDLDPITFETSSNPAYTRIDLTARWQARPRLAPYLRIENAADEQYEEALGFPAADRTFVAGVALAIRE